MNAQQLRYAVQQWLNIERVGLLVILESFGFKYGVPNNADFMFDMRSLPNPYYDPELRPFTGMDKPIQDYLGQQPLVQEMVDDIDHFISRWLPRLQQESRSYVTIAIGCTGGQHRSVLCCGKTGRAPQRPLRTPCPAPSGTKLGRTLTCRFRRPQRKKP